MMTDWNLIYGFKLISAILLPDSVHPFVLPHLYKGWQPLEGLEGQTGRERDREREHSVRMRRWTKEAIPPSKKQKKNKRKSKKQSMSDKSSTVLLLDPFHGGSHRQLVEFLLREVLAEAQVGVGMEFSF